MTIAHRSPLNDIRKFALAAGCLGLAGCIVNATRLYAGGTPAHGSSRAIAIVGLTVDRASRLQDFRVVLDQYDIARQAITGGCWTYNRIEAAVPGAAAPIRFFAFELPAGHYIYSAFNRMHEVSGVRFDGIDQAFQLPAGHTVYIGNFVLDGDRVALRRELDQDRAALTQALPKLAPAVEAAAVVTALPAKPFMCAP